MRYRTLVNLYMCTCCMSPVVGVAIANFLALVYSLWKRIRSLKPRMIGIRKPSELEVISVTECIGSDLPHPSTQGRTGVRPSYEGSLQRGEPVAPRAAGQDQSDLGGSGGRQVHQQVQRNSGEQCQSCCSCRLCSKLHTLLRVMATGISALVSVPVSRCH